MLLVNICGAPGSGKTTFEAWLYYRLKLLGYNAEQISEVSKELIYDGSEHLIQNSLYVLGLKYHRLMRLIGKVDVAITDSPIILSKLYNKISVANNEFVSLVEALAINTTHFFQIYIFINRTHKYSKSARLQSEEESDAIAKRYRNLLIDANIDFIEIDATDTGYNLALEYIMNRL
jgi:tRNA uridine 5-carbamoylmethylation protein Kti12